MESPSYATIDDGVACTVCRQTGEEARMLLCDGAGCGKGFHTFCLEPPLKGIPKGDWFCDSCLRGEDRLDKPNKDNESENKNKCQTCLSTGDTKNLFSCGGCGKFWHVYCNSSVDALEPWECNKCSEKDDQQLHPKDLDAPARVVPISLPHMPTPRPKKISALTSKVPPHAERGDTLDHPDVEEGVARIAPRIAKENNTSPRSFSMTDIIKTKKRQRHPGSPFRPLQDSPFKTRRIGSAKKQQKSPRSFLGSAKGTNKRAAKRVSPASRAQLFATAPLVEIPPITFGVEEAREVKERKNRF